MTKIAFLGAGSTIFVKAVIGDCMLTESLQDAHVALYDIDRKRLQESKRIVEALNAGTNRNRMTITAHHGVRSRKTALRNADFVVNAVQVGGYEPCTVTDFEVPKKFGLRQTIGDTLGIGGIFRALRTIPVLLEFAEDMESVCPDAWLLNYSNPMAMLTGALLEATSIRTVGLCHSVQRCAEEVLKRVGMLEEVSDLRQYVAGINHMAWLLDVRDGDRDLYPEIRKRAKRMLAEAKTDPEKRFRDSVRFEMLRTFGYYVTESSEHNAEYLPYFIKSTHPELIDRYRIPLDEYPRRCVRQIEGWRKTSQKLLKRKRLQHERTIEYAADIMDAVVRNAPARIHGNVLNLGLITNLPAGAVVEVPCLVDAYGVQGCRVGALPEQCAALNRTNINVQLCTIEAALTRKKEAIYHAAQLDPHTSSELTIDEIRRLVDALIRAHGDWLPSYR